jgi:hypothetical protein
MDCFNQHWDEKRAIREVTPLAVPIHPAIHWFRIVDCAEVRTHNHGGTRQEPNKRRTTKQTLALAWAAE